MLSPQHAQPTADVFLCPLYCHRSDLFSSVTFAPSCETVQAPLQLSAVVHNTHPSVAKIGQTPPPQHDSERAMLQKTGDAFAEGLVASVVANSP
ncbi:MAG: hypothetical protein GY904_20815 [Planctomycetaceae bacterium]|nr:hypothetical protein [Planctomycetaceae bacterium]